ncbi:uncharacterized protein LOC110385294 isoform X3 [Bombyx mori]|uniref:Ricin B lectin domain-containing protein n=1 Tax=Bombyx mori TaxID=7091 RepID=A0A8R2M2J6_BOMMO|nr:uncharacterized protein LOC110385294 isoform X3 [Bombyx mori]
MFYFPARKCAYIAKIGILFTLVIALITFFEQWRGGKRSVDATFSDPIEAEFERQILEDEARIIPGLGDGGVAAYLTGEDKRLGEESEKKLAMNVHLSDRIAYNRTLKDYRNPACQRVVYDAELPSVSVILIFHNEPYSVVIRTIWSVINSARRDQPWYSKANFVERGTGRTMQLGYPGQDPTSSLVYLKEIILVDDNSTLPELKGKLSYYVKTRLPPDLIRILRLPDRVGLTQARMAGSRVATSEVMIFLDSHCEGVQDWIRPLLQEIKNNNAVVIPLIDVIEQDTFQYQTGNLDYEVGGFTFTGHFTWIDVPEREKKRRGSDIAPTWSPTMAGGLFAINRAYFWELGAYDEQMAGWGGENLEMSFRIWQCGGTLETVPCSRVGHVFRSFHPYGLPAQSDTHGINTARMAEVWMDEYAELFYLHRPDLRNNPKIGDVTHRKVLREKLKCKDFQWYLDNVYEDKFVPVRDVYGFGRFKNPASGFCLDTMQRDVEASSLGVYPCHSTLQATQYLSLSLRGELRDEEKCAQLQYTRSENDVNDDTARRVLMTSCHGKQRGQKWKYIPSTSQLQHVDSGLCLDAGFEVGADVTARACSGKVQQRWLIDYAEYNQFKGKNGETSERDEKLRRLRGQRRKSRSLLSHEGDAQQRSHEHRSRKRKQKRRKNKSKKKRKRKDKFILTLLRSRPGAPDEHLEAELYCRHARLHPNNSFVRDLVAILNDKDVKVINNGRLFERGGVTVLRDAEIKKMKIKSHDDIDDVTTSKPSHKKFKTTPSVKRIPAVNVATLAPPAHRGKQLNKKIIIEEFVAVAPDEKTKKLKKRKRKHRRRTTVPPAAYGEGEGVLDHNTERNAHASVELTDAPPSSAEDTPMLMGAERGADRKVNELLRDDSRENWDVGESRFRRNNSQTLLQPLRRLTTDEGGADSGDESSKQDDVTPERDEDRKPVKVVLRSNLTFNIGDDFFPWRPREDEKDDTASTKDAKAQQIQLIIKPNPGILVDDQRPAADVRSDVTKTSNKRIDKHKDLSNYDRSRIRHVSGDGNIDQRQEDSFEDDNVLRGGGKASSTTDDKSDGSSSSSESCDD